MTESKNFLESVWEHREDVVYRRVFGDTGPGIYPLSADLFTRTFGKSCDPRWLTIGVFECPPTVQRPTWVYVSSGLSNPWELDGAPDDPSELSGLGVEYVFNTTAQAEWAIQLVQYVTAYDLLLNHGAIPDHGPIAIGDRIPVQIRDRADRLSLLRRLMIIEPAFIPARHQLASGELHFFQLIGITEPEADLARASDTSTLCERLREAGVLDITDPWRSSIV
jgi:hypothetical protein